MSTWKGFMQAAIAAALIASGGVSAEPLQPSPLPPEGARWTVFISDLHMGMGRQRQDAATGHWTQGPWHATEDFRWAPEFTLFLAHLQEAARQSAVSIDVVILGDLLELWQSASDDCRYPGESGADGKDLGCTAVDALARAQRVLGAHREELAALRALADDGDNRLAIVPGNHDAALVFDSVAAALLKAIDAGFGRVRVAREGYWRSRDGQILAEHGHAFEGEVNRYDLLPASCLDGQARISDCAARERNVYLRRPWGEQFVQSYYNQFEERYPIIDNISEEGEGVKLGVAAAGIGDVAVAVKDFFRFFLFGQSIDQLKVALGPQEAASRLLRYDIDAIRKQGDRFLVESIPPNDPLRPLAEAALARDALGLKSTALNEQEIADICHLRQARFAVAQKQGGAVTTPLCPVLPEDATLGAAATALFVSRDARFRNRLNEVRGGLANDGRPTREFAVYIYGHTHKAHGPQRFFEPGAEWNPQVFNSGAWQRVATPDQLKAIQQQQGIPDAEALLRLQPEDLPPCYTYVSIPPYDAGKGGRPSAELLYWTQDKAAGTWRSGLECVP